MTEFLQLINFDRKTLITWFRLNVTEIIEKKRVWLIWPDVRFHNWLQM